LEDGNKIMNDNELQPRPLFNEKHQINLDEALVRIDYWISHIDNKQALGAIKLLLASLKTNEIHIGPGGAFGGWE
jgi:hypothetical protein